MKNLIDLAEKIDLKGGEIPSREIPYSANYESYNSPSDGYEPSSITTHCVDCHPTDC